ncbi:MAG: hypothetical protein KDB00_18355 [Planctomycetales bacterium]|nr:hypothetical protein [Planctomycetales bacterium]
MSTELLYTSAPQGLRHGSRGFCTVLTTAGMPINVISRLEGISSYRHLPATVIRQGSGNPVSYSHQRLNLGGQIVSVISRISAYGVDYSRRPNKIAHHVTIDNAEMPAAGPAWLLRQRAVIRSEWLGQCETPPSGPAIPRGDQQSRICTAWKTIAGDAGWGGVVAESISSGSTEPLWVIYPLEHQDRLLELMDEAIALLPAGQRWRATFNTYATNIPPDVECKVRFVPSVTDEARAVAASGKTINLTKHQSITTASQWVERARGTFRGSAAVDRVSVGVEKGGTPSTEMFTAVQQQYDEIPMESSWSSDDDASIGPPPSLEPPSLPPEFSSGKSSRRQLWIAIGVLAGITGLGATWTVARLTAGLPILPGTVPDPVQETPRYTPEPEPKAAPVVVPVQQPATTLVLNLHYDKKQILAWALESPELDSPFPSLVSLRGSVNLIPVSTDTDSKPPAGDVRRQSAGLETVNLVSWGGEPRSLYDKEKRQITSTLLTAGSHWLNVEPLPDVPEALGNTEILLSRDTSDLVAVAEFDFSANSDFLSEQRSAYRNYVVMLSRTALRLDSLENESKQLPELLKDSVDSFFRLAFPGRGESRIASMIRKAGTLDIGEEAIKLVATLQDQQASSKQLDKTQQGALVRVVSDCGQITQFSTELQRAFEVLEKGHSVEVPELVFLESKGVPKRRVPIRFHFSW